MIWALAGAGSVLLGVAFIVTHPDESVRSVGWGLIVLGFTSVTPIRWQIHLAHRGRDTL